jgi:peptidylprolyl isomerase
MLIEMPKDRFPNDMEIELGMTLGMSDGQGQQFQVMVAEIKDDVILLDANHPLAGHDLVFDLELIAIDTKSLIIMP